MPSITNKDIFEEFTRLIRDGATDEKLMEEYGGMPIYVPSWSQNGRNKLIIQDFTDGFSPKDLKFKYKLSLGRIYEIIKDVREPTLL